MGIGSIFSRNEDTNFDAAEILGEGPARIFDSVAQDGFMGKALSNVRPSKIKEEGIALVGIVGDNSRSAYGDIHRNYAASLQPALGAAHDKIVTDQLANVEEGVATLVTYSLVDGTLVYGLTAVEDVVLLGTRNGKKVKAKDLIGLAGPSFNPSELLDYGHLTTRFPMTDYTKLRDRIVQQGVALVGESLKWKNLGRTVNATGCFCTDGLDMGSDLDAAGCTEVMAALDSVGFYNNFGAIVGEVNGEFRRLLVLSIGWSGVAGPRRDIDESQLGTIAPETVGMSTEDLLGWYMKKQGLAGAVDGDLFLTRSTAPRDIAVTAGQLSQVVQQASVLVDPAFRG